MPLKMYDIATESYATLNDEEALALVIKYQKLAEFYFDMRLTLFKAIGDKKRMPTSVKNLLLAQQEQIDEDRGFPADIRESRRQKMLRGLSPLSSIGA